MAAIHLLPIGDAPSLLLHRLAPLLADRFAPPVVVDPPWPPRPEWLDPLRGRYSTTAILHTLADDPPADGGWRLALLAGELFADGVESAAGAATVGGCCGVVALAPLDPAAPGDPAAADLLFRRTLVEAVHELGHMAGLRHCPDPLCVMHPSRTIEDTDRKTPDFCERCRA